VQHQCRLECAQWTRDETKYWGWVKTPVQFYAVCAPKFTKFWENVGDPLYFPTPLPDCLCHVSFRRCSPLSLEALAKPYKCNSFPPIFWQTVSAIYCPPCGKVWLSFVCWSPPANTGNELECRIYGKWVKMMVQFLAVCRPKFMAFRDNVGDILYFVTLLPDCQCHVSFRRYSPLCLEFVQKPYIFDYQFFTRDDPDFSTADC